MKSSTGNRIWGLGATDNPVSYQCPLPSRFGTLNSKFNISSFTSVFGVQCSIFSVSNDRSYASAWARTLLTLSNTGYLYQEPIIIDHEYMPRKGRITTAKSNLPQMLKVYPNPAHTFVNVDLSNFDIASNDHLTVADLKGNEVFYENLKMGQSGCVVDVRKWKPGIYVFTYWHNSKPTSSIRVAIQ